MTTTETDDGGKVDALVLKCDKCLENSTLLPSACRLSLYTHGLMLLRFFCLHCKDLAVLSLARVAFAERIEQTGVPTDIIRVPMEMSEHPPEDRPAINAGEVRYMEMVPLTFFNEARVRELR